MSAHVDSVVFIANATDDPRFVEIVVVRSGTIFERFLVTRFTAALFVGEIARALQ